MKPIIALNLLGIFLKILFCHANDFSSFLSANASLAIIIDDEYTKKRGEDIFSQVQTVVDDTVRKNIENGGINVRYYSWGYVKLKKDFVAAITVTDCAKTWKFYEMAEYNSILLLAITEANCPRLPIDRAVMIPIIPKGDEIPQFLLDIKLQNVLKWKSCILLFDSLIEDESTNIISSLSYTSSKSLFNPIALYLHKIDNNLAQSKRREAIRSAIRRFKYQRGSRFIVFTTSSEEVIDIATSMDMFNVFNQWLFFLPVTADTSNIYAYTERLNEGANIAYAINSTSSECQVLGPDSARMAFQENILCSITEVIFGFVTGLSKVIQQESVLYGQISDEEWEAIRLTKRERQNEILAHIKNYLIYQSKCSGCSKWTLRSMESWGKTGQYERNTEHFEDYLGGRYIFTEIGHWNSMSGFSTRDVLFPHVEHKFRNITLDIYTFNNQPWQNILTNEKGEVIESSGYVIEILKELSSKLNFSYVLRALDLEENLKLLDVNHPDYLGSTTNVLTKKLIQDINEKKYFMIAAGVTIDQTEFVPFNFTVPVTTQQYTFLVQRPSEQSRMYLFTAPFQIATWVCLLCVVLITAPVLYYINKYGAINAFKVPGLCKLENCYWYIYGALLQQGGMYLPKADSGRVVVGIWWVVVIVLVTTYCGNLVAFLTFPKFNAGNDYLSDIFDHKQIHTFGVRNGTYFAKYATDSMRKDIKQYIEHASFYNDVSQEGLDAILKGKRSNIDWRINLQIRMQRDFDKNKICNFILGKEDIMNEKIGLILPAKSPFLELINDEIVRLRKFGFLHKWRKQYFPPNDRCSMGVQSRQIVNHMVNLNDMQGCFLVLLIGFMFGAFIIICEFLLHHCCKPKEDQTKFIN